MKSEKSAKIIDSYETEKAPVGLLERILSRIKNEREMISARRKIFLFSVFVAVSLPIMAFSLADFRSVASESGLFQLASLAVTDFSEVSLHLQDFAMSLAEALPILSVAGIIAGILLFVESATALIRNAKMVYKLN